jgi:hypothetical protein
MKAVLVAMSLVFVAIRSSGQQTPQAELAATLENFKQAFARQDAAEVKAVAPVKAAYLQDLARIRDNFKSKGDLDALVDAEAALKAAQDETPAPPAKKAGALLNQARVKFDKDRETAIRTYASGRPRIEADFERSMTALEQKYTRAGNLEAAGQVRDAKSSLAVSSEANLLSAMKGETTAREGFVELAKDKVLTTEKSYAPPIEITYVVKTDGQVRIGYAANQIIFNWESDRGELRIDGGPASGQHGKGQGGIPTNAWITIKQVVLPNGMTVSVNGERRARWVADFRRINTPIKLFAPLSTLGVKQVAIRKIDSGK